MYVYTPMLAYEPFTRREERQHKNHAIHAHTYTLTSFFFRASRPLFKRPPSRYLARPFSLCKCALCAAVDNKKKRDERDANFSRAGLEIQRCRCAVCAWSVRSYELLRLKSQCAYLCATLTRGIAISRGVERERGGTGLPYEEHLCRILMWYNMYYAAMKWLKKNVTGFFFHLMILSWRFGCSIVFRSDVHGWILLSRSLC